MHKHAELAETVYFWFGANDTSGSGGDGASPAADVRLAGAAADAAPVLSPTPPLLRGAGYPAGCYEVAVAATEGNGFAAGNEYAVFCTLLIDSQNPTGFVGSFTLLAAGKKPYLQVDASDYGKVKDESGNNLPHATVFSGITSLANWLRALARKDAADGTAKTAINSGGGSYNEATDAQEGMRDTAPLGTAMRGTDSANTTVPDAAGTAAALHATTNALAPLGTAMRGTDSANTTVPDAAGTASSLHGTTNGLIAALNNITAASVWAVGTRTLTSFGSLIAGIWAYASRTLTGGGGDATAANQTSMIKLLEADYSIDTTATPWELVVTQSGTATELLRKKLYQADGTNVTSADHLVGRHTNTATQ